MKKEKKRKSNDRKFYGESCLLPSSFLFFNSERKKNRKVLFFRRKRSPKKSDPNLRRPFPLINVEINAFVKYPVRIPSENDHFLPPFRRERNSPTMELRAAISENTDTVRRSKAGNFNTNGRAHKCNTMNSTISPKRSVFRLGPCREWDHTA